VTVTRLLAKSSPTPDHPHGAATLQGHTAFVLESAGHILRARGEASIQAARLSGTGADLLARIVRLAAFVHDLGKCSDHFQAMVRGLRKKPQLVRHEALSLWLTWPGQPLSEWLRAAVPHDNAYLTALLAAVGHHRKFWNRAFASESDGAGSSLRLLTAHPDFASVLSYGAKQLGLAAPPTFARDLDVKVTWREHPKDRFEAWKVDAEQRFTEDSDDSRLLAVAKAMLVCADVAGSALPRGQEKPTWIAEHLDRRGGRDVFDAVVTRRLAGKPLRPFQSAVAASRAPVTFVRAGCGTGKTIAAYRWHAERHPDRQLWVTYPTTGTATEGFRDYLREAPIEARLEHGRASVDYEIFGLDEDDGEGRRLDRLDSIRAWGDDVITCTVDTVLGLVQNHRKGMYAWPGLSHGAVVFDEVHAYDDRLFDTLLRFLEALPGVPALVMTASLPRARLERLRDLVRRVHGEELLTIEGPEALETHPRYTIRVADDPWHDVRRALAAGLKVLWVSNTVKRCVRVVEREASALLYHSRFRYADRVKRHGGVIAAFANQGAVLASTTQVAEMSLDLSADLLVTDIAPIPSLIQRLGRLNRRSTPETPSPIRECLVLDVEDTLPYSRTELEAARQWLGELGKVNASALSARDLVRAWRDDLDEGPRDRGHSAWLDGRFLTEPSQLRDTSPGVTVLRRADAQAIEKGIEDAVRVAIPMGPVPKGIDWRAWKTVAFLPVAPDEALDYDERRGGQWRAS
jgi:CRISPR-associated endonuclease/helicase Cas3